MAIKKISAIIISASIIVIFFGAWKGLWKKNTHRSANLSLKTPEFTIPSSARIEMDENSSIGSVAIWNGENNQDSLTFVSDEAKNVVTVWNQNTNQAVRSLGGFSSPQGIAVSQKEGAVYIADSGNLTIKKYTVEDIIHEKNPSAVIELNAQSETMNKPKSLAVYESTKDGKSYLLGTYPGETTSYLRGWNSDDGSLAFEWQTPGVVIGSIEIDAEREFVYVGGKYGASIKIYKIDGTFVKEFGKENMSNGDGGIKLYACGNDGYLITANESTNKFEVFDRWELKHLSEFKVSGVRNPRDFALREGGTSRYPLGLMYVVSNGKFMEIIDWEEVNKALGVSICANEKNTNSVSDAEAPGAPSKLAANAISASQINLSWKRPTDVDVAAFKVYRDGAEVGQSFDGEFKDVGLDGLKKYTYSVVAIDDSGNASKYSEAVEIVTPAPIEGDESTTTKKKAEEKKKEENKKAEIQDTKPFISSFWSATLSTTSIKVVWTTSEDTDGMLVYGSLSATHTVVTDPVRGLKHSIILKDLAPDTEYYIQGISKDTAGQEVKTKEANAKTLVSDPVAPETTAIPFGGAYEERVVIALVPNKPSAVYYTLDGTKPNASSSVYEDQFTFTTTTILKYFAIDSAGKREQVQTQKYTIFEKVEPETKVNQELRTPEDPIDRDERYEDRTASEEDSIAVYLAPIKEESLLFVTHKTGNKVEAWDLVLNQVTKTIIGLNGPQGITVDNKEGVLYIADSGNLVIKKYRISDIMNGNMMPILVIGQNLTVAQEPLSVTILHDGIETRVYATYTGNGKKYIRVWSPDGSLISEWSLSVGVEGIKADQELKRIYVTDEWKKVVKVYTKDGKFIEDIGSGIFTNDPESIEVYSCDKAGYLIVSDPTADAFRIFDRKSLNYLASFQIFDADNTHSIALVENGLPRFQKGVFFAQSRDRFIEGVRWERIQEETGMTTCAAE